LLLDAAHEALDRGWQLVPIEYGTKEPAAGYGLDHRVVDHGGVDRAWRRHPRAQLAVACAPSGLVAFDADLRHGADVNALERAGDLPATRVVRTPGGRHTIFTANPDLRFPRYPPAFPGYEIKHRGYVLAPPSVHPDGGRYELPCDDDPAPIPEWLLEIATRTERAEDAGAVLHPNVIRGTPRYQTAAVAYARAVIAGAYADVVDARHGERNNRLNASAFAYGRLVAAGLLEETRAVAALLEAADLCGVRQDDGDRQTLATIRSGLRAGAEHPMELNR
jgi:hypothetical protein